MVITLSLLNSAGKGPPFTAISWFQPLEPSAWILNEYLPSRTNFGSSFAVTASAHFPVPAHPSAVLDSKFHKVTLFVAATCAGGTAACAGGGAACGCGAVTGARALGGAGGVAGIL